MQRNETAQRNLDGGRKGAVLQPVTRHVALIAAIRTPSACRLSHKERPDKLPATFKDSILKLWFASSAVLALPDCSLVTS
jgi:hypothetical protein